MTPAERQLYNLLAKLQGTMLKLIGKIESMKILLAGASG
jgi:hypothetical protein